MNGPLIAAGALAVIGAGVHGIAGQVLVVRKLTPATLPASALGGPRTTRLMVQVTWHLVTVAFLAVGAALLLAGTALEGDAADALALFGAAATTGFALVVSGLGGAARSPRALVLHPAPGLLTAAAALAWWGAL